MVTARRRGAIYLTVMGLMIGFYTLVYNLGIATLEGRPQSLDHSLRVVIESITTTGYGSDAPWTHPFMNALTIAMQASGIISIFAAIPVFIVPVLSAALETDPPTESDLQNHVVICEFTPHGGTLLEELDTVSVPYVLVVTDDAEARELHEDGLQVVHADPETIDGLRAAGVPDARAVVADAGDERNASITLSAREVAPDVQITALVAAPDAAEYQRYAGADRVLSPEEIIGASLASKITARVSSDLADAVAITEDFEIAELSIQSDSEVTGVTLAETDIRERTGANVIGVWQEGEFTTPPDPEMIMTEGTVLLVTGSEEQLDATRQLTQAPRRRYGRGTVVVAGYGAVGAAVTDALTAADVNTTTIDLADGTGVDIVGDVTEEGTLREAGTDDARTIVVAVDDDTTAVFTTLVVREIAPDTEVIARVSEAETVDKLYRAGADYVLALSTVSGRMLASTILEEDVVSFDTRIEVVRVPVPGLAGQRLDEADIRARTGCTVIAVERNGGVETTLSPGFRLEDDDVAVVAGTDTSVNRFAKLAEAEAETVD
ncbi:metal transporter [Halobacteriales archaeon SW_7_68_16]|nr:MAG: metal transporter [Halobacteriales archaeon SW_7_68_16]